MDRERVTEAALELVTERPDHFTKTSLAETLGGRRQDALSVIGALLADGQIGPDQARAKLRLVGGAREPSHEDTSP